MNLIRSMATVGGFTLVSRVLGVVRDKLVTYYLGAQELGDVWVTAFRLPNLFRRIFGEGAFNAAFVPMYSRRLEEHADGDAATERADAFAGRTISLMAAILVVLLVLCYIFMEPLVAIIAWGFRGDARFGLAVEASRVTIVYLVFICLMAAVSGVLNSRKVFGPPAFAYVVLNVVFLVALGVFVPGSEDPLGVLSRAVVVAGVLQLGVVVLSCWRRGIRIPLGLPKIDADMRRLGLLMLPGLASAGVQQLNLLVGQSVASLQVGGNSAIFYSDRINQLPLGLIGMAAGVVLLPEITRNLRGGQEEQARVSMSRGVEISMLLTLPAMVAMFVIPQQIMHAIFEGGRFTAEDARQAGYSLAAFAIGTPAYVLAKVLQPGYFAREDTRTPMRFTLVTAAVNIALCWPLFKLMGHTGCALATSVAGWVNVLLLWSGLRGIGFLRVSRGFAGRIGRMLLCSVLMGWVVWWLAQVAGSWLLCEGRFTLRMVVLVALVAVGAGMYFIFVFALRVFTVAEVRASLRRKQPSQPAQG
jgi:putative peptidoglycan lipid II flippase